jgi:hypothetical protein
LLVETSLQYVVQLCVAVRRKVCDVDACESFFVIDQGLVIQGRQIPSGALNHPRHVGQSPVKPVAQGTGKTPVREQTEFAG